MSDSRSSTLEFGCEERDWLLSCHFTEWEDSWRYHHFTQVYHKWHTSYDVWYDVWFLRYAIYCFWNMTCDGCNFNFSFGVFFALLPSLPSNNPENRKTSSFYTCAPKNYNQMMYGSWYMQHDGGIDGGTKRVAYWGGCPI